jgi:hypothetical protein
MGCEANAPQPRDGNRRKLWITCFAYLNSA